MPQEAYHLDETRTRVLLSFYRHTRMEIDRYRDLEWKIPSYVLALFSAAIILTINEKFSSLFGLVAKTLFTVIVLALIVFSVIFLWHCHEKLTIHRQRRQWLEVILRLYASGEFVELSQQEINELPEYLRPHPDRILPPAKRSENITFRTDFWPYTVAFMGLIALVGILVAVLIWRPTPTFP